MKSFKEVLLIFNNLDLEVIKQHDYLVRDKKNRKYQKNSIL